MDISYFVTSTPVLLIVLLFLLILGAMVGLAFITANIARKKGYGYAGFFIFSLFGFVPAFVIALCLPNRTAEIEKICKTIRDNAN